MKQLIQELKAIAEELKAGKDRVPKYVVDTVHWDKTKNDFIWEKRYGKPTVKNLEKYCEDFNKSLESGKPNSHIGLDYMIIKASIRENHAGAKPIVTWEMKNVPKFIMV